MDRISFVKGLNFNWIIYIDLCSNSAFQAQSASYMLWSVGLIFLIELRYTDPSGMLGNVFLKFWTANGLSPEQTILRIEAAY